MSALIKTQLFINGEYVDPVKKGTFPCINPATGALIADVADGTQEDIDLAIHAAETCLFSPNWGFNSSGADRAQVLRALGSILSKNKDYLAKLDSLDMGKPLREAESDLSDAITSCEFYAKLAEERDKKQLEVIDNGTGGDFTTRILLEPIGIVGAITPWNYPLLMGLWKVIPALAAGCCVVLKPSELAPLSCLALGELCNEAGLPRGALNVVSGLGAHAGAALSEHEKIDKVSFTGSVPTARKVMAACAMGPRALSLELGGKSPIIVFDDADVSAAVDWIMVGFLWGSGQVCSATSRLLVQKSLRPHLVNLLLERVAKITLGDSLSERILALNPSTAMGPVVSEGQYQKILRFLDEAAQEGLCFACGSPEQQKALRSGLETAEQGGYYVFPAILTDVPLDSRVWREEIFGPVLCVRVRFAFFYFSAECGTSFLL